MRFEKLIILLAAALLPAFLGAETEAELRAKEQKLKGTGITAEADARAMKRKVSTRQAVLVLPARSIHPVPPSLLEKTTEVLNVVLIDLGRFKVVDRKALKKALEQQALSATGLIPEASQLRMGEIVGATEIIEARINRYSVEFKVPTTGGGAASSIAGSLLSSGLSALLGTGGQSADDGKRWVATVEATLIHKDLATGKVKDKKDFKVESVDKDSRASAENKLDGKLEAEIRFVVKELFPIISFIVKKEGRDTYMRLGADMGVRPHNRYFAYAAYDPKSNNQPVGELRIREVFPTLSRGTMRIEKSKVLENYVVKERNLRDGRFSLALGMAPLRMDTSTFTQFRTYVNAGSYYGVNTFMNVKSFLLPQYTFVPQASLSYAAEFGPSALDIRVSALFGFIEVWGAKALLGYKLTAVDRDFFTAGFSVHVGGAGVGTPIGDFRPAFAQYFHDSKLNIPKEGATVSLLGATLGGEVMANFGFNLGYDSKFLIEVGYCYYLPMSRYSVSAPGIDTDGKDTSVDLSRYFDTSLVSPIDLTGLTVNLSLNFSF